MGDLDLCRSVNYSSWQEDTTVKCWGRNDIGQLGLGRSGNRGEDFNREWPARPMLRCWSGGMGLVADSAAFCFVRKRLSVSARIIATTQRVSSFRLPTRAYWCCPGAEMGGNLAPVDLGDGRTRTALSVSAGGLHTCALLVPPWRQPIIDGFLSQLPYTCHQNRVASVGG